MMKDLQQLTWWIRYECLVHPYSRKEILSRPKMQAFLILFDPWRYSVYVPTHGPKKFGAAFLSVGALAF